MRDLFLHKKTQAILNFAVILFIVKPTGNTMFDLIEEDEVMSRPMPAFVVAATVAAELDAAVHIARDMSIVAKNARAIALRAGEQAAGFKAITNFINEMASITIDVAFQINEVATELSKLAVLKIRSEDSLTRVAAVKVDPDNENGQKKLKHIIGVIKIKHNKLDKELSSSLRQLEDQLEEINQQMRAAGVIAVTSKVEASRAGEYQDSLNVVAENVQKAADGIRDHVRKSSSLLAVT